MKIEIIFDQLIIFSTNFESQSLVDAVFLRRLRYKIKIEYPTVSEYKEIFKRICISSRGTCKIEIYDRGAILNFINTMTWKLQRNKTNKFTVASKNDQINFLSLGVSGVRCSFSNVFLCTFCGITDH